ERIGQRDRLAVERDLTFVHRLEKGRLGARARAVDLVGEQDVREDRALLEGELARALIEDGDAEHVAREKIARELNEGQIAADSLGQRARERRLADALDVFDAEAAAREERYRGEPHRFLLPLPR